MIQKEFLVILTQFQKPAGERRNKVKKKVSAQDKKNNSQNINFFIQRVYRKLRSAQNSRRGTPIKSGTVKGRKNSQIGNDRNAIRNPSKKVLRVIESGKRRKIQKSPLINAQIRVKPKFLSSGLVTQKSSPAKMRYKTSIFSGYNDDIRPVNGRTIASSNFNMMRTITKGSKRTGSLERAFHKNHKHPSINHELDQKRIRTNHTTVRPYSQETSAIKNTAKRRMINADKEYHPFIVSAPVSSFVRPSVRTGSKARRKKLSIRISRRSVGSSSVSKSVQKSFNKLQNISIPQNQTGSVKTVSKSSSDGDGSTILDHKGSIYNEFHNGLEGTDLNNFIRISQKKLTVHPNVK